MSGLARWADLPRQSPAMLERCAQDAFVFRWRRISSEGGRQFALKLLQLRTGYHQRGGKHDGDGVGISRRECVALVVGYPDGA